MNKTKITITDYADSMLTNVTGSIRSKEAKDISLHQTLKLIVGLQHAFTIGASEVINHTMLGKLRNSGIKFTQE